MDWQEYRGLAMLLSDTGLHDLLAMLTSVACRSTNLDIREVAEDFQVG
jgi:hypothetical protein